MKKSKSSIVSKSPISSGNMNPTQMLIFSLMFIAAGVFVIGIPFDLFSMKGNMRAPKEIIILAGLVFLLAGCSIFFQSLTGLKKQRRRKEMKRRFPTSPWKWDYEWNQKFITPRSKNSLLQHFFGFSIVLIFLAITYWIGFIDKAQFKYPFYGMCFFVGIILIWFYSMISKRIKYGAPRLKFSNFPFHLGKEINVMFESLPPRESIKESIVTIRYYKEVFTKNHKGETRISLNKLYEDQKVYSSKEHTINRELKVNLNLPDDLSLENKISEVPAKFWEIQIQCDIEGWDYREYYLLPIYSS
jgi:magnesium-transporting ATPase (P-type)